MIAIASEMSCFDSAQHDVEGARTTGLLLYYRNPDERPGHPAGYFFATPLNANRARSNVNAANAASAIHGPQAPVKVSIPPSCSL